MVGPTGIEPVCIAARDFKSLVSTYFTTVLSLDAAALRSVVGLTGGTRTPDLQLRRLLLYPVELQSDSGGPPVSRTRHQRIMSPLL